MFWACWMKKERNKNGKTICALSHLIYLSTFSKRVNQSFAPIVHKTTSFGRNKSCIQLFLAFQAWITTIKHKKIFFTATRRHKPRGWPWKTSRQTRSQATRTSAPWWGVTDSSRPCHIPFTHWLQALFEGVLLGEGETERLRRLLTLSQMHPSFLSPQEATPTSRSTLPTNLCAPSLGQTERRAAVSDRTGFSSSWGRTRQCREERQLPGPKSTPPTSPPPPLPSQLRSSEGADKKVVQNIIVAAEWAWVASSSDEGKIVTNPSVEKDSEMTPNKNLLLFKLNFTGESPLRSSIKGFFAGKPSEFRRFAKISHRKWANL